MIKNVEAELAPASPEPEPAPQTPAPGEPDELPRAPTTKSPAAALTSVRPAPRVRVATSDSSVPGTTFAVRASAVLAYQVAATVSRGMLAELALGHARWEGQLGMLALFSTHEELARSGVSFHARPLAASLAGALRVVSARSVVVRVSLGLLVGRLRVGMAAPAQLAQPLPAWVASKLALELALPVGAGVQGMLSLGPVWSWRKLGVRATGEDDVELGRRPFKNAGLLLAIGIAYARERQGYGAQAHR